MIMQNVGKLQIYTVSQSKRTTQMYFWQHREKRRF